MAQLRGEPWAPSQSMGGAGGGVPSLYPLPGPPRAAGAEIPPSPARDGRGQPRRRGEGARGQARAAAVTEEPGRLKDRRGVWVTASRRRDTWLQMGVARGR